ncbi:hypothetical protein ELE36_19735 [Pseudolysobacter antarcticus]|uniref:Uncharacterized protein n=1 Tax=Pseudolysobacter antarcticus TaxID=2511995 RepID=A0A411HPI8_9GAMM|nr:hypothetical protein [Pseudolysobacter antarcticus]QBB72419.1 hypothetical protein ELE36_19735 [Pseudolysobacter antarcticus]
MNTPTKRWMESQVFLAGLSCLFFAGVCMLASNVLGVPDRATPLWTFCVIQIAPITALGILFGKLTDIRDIDGLTRTERRRLESLVNSKIRQLIFLIAFHVVAGLILALALYGASFGRPAVAYAFTLAGALIGLSVYFTVSAYVDVKHIAAFKTKIADRTREAKARASVMAKLIGKRDAPKA